MDEPVDEESGTGPGNARPQRQRSSIPSFLFISFMLFMLTNHNGDEFLARHKYQDALQSLNYQLSNYTAWLNGTTSNFTLPDRNLAMEPLLDYFNVFNPYVDRNTESYFPNITGFIQGDTNFHNITTASWSNSSKPVPTWGSLSQPLMAETNMTELVERLGTWNWTASEKVAMSVMEKTLPDVDLTERVSMVHGRIELTDAATKEEFRLEFEGVHFITSGSIFGFADPVGRHIDIRLLPAIVPSAHKNDTVRMIEPELNTRIDKLKNLIDGGIIDQDITNDEIPRSTCPFTLYAQIAPVYVPEDLMLELEDELQTPTGIWTVKTPKLSVGGVLISTECGILYEIVNTEGLRSKTFFRKVTTYAGTATLAYFFLLVLLARQMHISRTPAGISRVSRYSFLTQAIVDSVSFAGHITFAILTEGRPSLSLVAPAFLACILFVYEAQFALLIYQIQLPEDAVPSSPSAPDNTIATPPTAIEPTQEGNTLPTATTTPPPIPAPTTPSFFSLFVRYLRADTQARLWLALFIFLTFIVRIILSPSITLLFVGTMYSFFWLPQVWRSARRGRSSGLTFEYLVGTTVCRLYFALYFLACPKNVLDVDPRGWVYLLAGFMFLQVLVVILQGRISPAFFLPKRFAARQTYDYHPPMPVVDPESPEQSLGDCAICMDAIHVGKEKSDLQSPGGALLNAVGGSGRKVYSLAPCHHLFHTECLERWLAIKNICPQCRRPLPPL